MAPLRDPEAEWCRVCGVTRQSTLAVLPPMLYSQRTAYQRMGPRRQRLHLWLWAHRDRIPNVAWRLYRQTWP